MLYPKLTMDLLDVECVLMEFVLENQLLQVVEGLLVRSLKKDQPNIRLKTQHVKRLLLW